MVVLYCVTLISATLAFAQKSQDTLRATVGNPQLQKELLDMEVNDQNVEHLFVDTMSQHPNDTLGIIAFIKKMDSVFNRNTAALKKILQRYGWPGIDLVGREGAEAAFLIVQHSTDTLFQRACLPLLRTACEHGQASGDNLALLTDRVLVRDGRPQLYGTQTKIVNGKIVLETIADSADVDARRAKLGLMPLSKYLELLRETIHLKDK